MTTTPDPEIGGYYQCFRQPKAFLHALTQYRRVYPDATLVVVSDNGHDYSHVVTRMGGQYIHDPNQSGDNVTTALRSAAKAKLYLSRFFEGARRMREPYFMLLEDDVNVCGRVSASSLQFDLNGCNNAAAVMWPSVLANLKEHGVDESKARYYGGCGGSVFRTAFFQDLPAKIASLPGGLDAVLAQYATLNPNYDSDILLSYLTLRFGGTVGGPPVELRDTADPQWQWLVRVGICKVLHQYKALYNKPPNEEDLKLLGWSENR